MAEPLHAVAYGITGTVIKDFLITDPGEEPTFYAHQLLHVDHVVCVEVSNTQTTFRVCDPDIEFADVVKN